MNLQTFLHRASLAIANRETHSTETNSLHGSTAECTSDRRQHANGRLVMRVKNL